MGLEIELDLNKKFYENLEKYFEEFKKLKEKREKLLEVIKKLEKERVEKKEREKKKLVEKKWYDKFRWFFTSNGLLVIAGKDAETNEILIRRYLGKNDIVIHADILGSPFGIIKNERGKGIDEKSILEAAQFVASYSRAWKYNLRTIEVYWVYPDQVSKRAPSGEYLKKGSFMIYGKKNYVEVPLEIAIGIDESGNLIPGVPSSVEKYSKTFVIIVPGNVEKNELAKQVSEVLGYKDISYLMKWVPYGGEIKEIRKGLKSRETG